MIPFDTLVELFTAATEPWNPQRISRKGDLLEPPTPWSVEQIQHEFGVIIPNDYVRIAQACPYYETWLAGIGEDYDHPHHILPTNHLFYTRTGEPDDYRQILPAHLIMVNHGYDGDGDCWDAREVTSTGEHPIVYLSVDAERLKLTDRRFDSFQAYIEDFAWHTVLSISRSRGAAHNRKQNAKRLLQKIESEDLTPRRPTKQG